MRNYVNSRRKFNEFIRLLLLELGTSKNKIDFFETVVYTNY